MIGEHHADLLMGVQAHRRRVEREALALGGAIGLRAAVLPHQLETADRVLTDTEVRHLIADEVGLGKTVEALMIVNALRLQCPSLRVLIVVPNGLSAQWRDELLARAHEAPVESHPDEDDPRRVRLAWPQVLSAAEVDPGVYDMLIVDEFHALTRTLQDRILSRSSAFRHLLLISATPPFEDPDRLDEILRMLEPTRAHQATLNDQREHAWFLRKDQETAEWLEDPDRAPWPHLSVRPAIDSPLALSNAYCAYRRVIRTRRETYRALMPIREHASRTVEPLEGEATRQRLMWRYFAYLGELSREFDLDLLAQRVIRSAASLRQRVTYLRGHGHEREGILEETAAWLGAEQGDSRFDALCDLLSELWLDEPDAKVLIAAGDNLTVDDLSRRLPEALGEIGPLDGARPVVPALIRNQTAGAIELADPEDRIERAVREFVVGDANVLLAADVGQLGLNLQVTRHIVLYSVPWDPQQIEQWVGRVDRIGNPATILPGREDPLPIRVHTIVQRGLVDERVLSVMEASSIFERSISLDSVAVKAVRDHIRAAALMDQGRAAWGEVVAEARKLGDRLELEDLGSPLLSHLPYGVERAIGMYDAVKRARPLEPAWTWRDDARGMAAMEDALRRWVLAMSHIGEFSIRKLWGEVRDEHPNVRSIQQIVLDTRPPKLMTRPRLGREIFTTLRRKAFFQLGRRSLRQPPRCELLYHDDPTPIHFLDHGSHLHEALCDAWMNLAESSHNSYRLRLAPNHPAHDPLKNKVIYLRVAALDPAELVDPSPAILAAIEDAPDLGVADLEHDQRLAAASRADQRFLRRLLPAQLLIEAAVVSKGRAQPLPPDLILALLAPPPREGPAVQSSSWVPTADLREALVAASEAVERRIAVRARDAWSPALPRLTERLSLRRMELEQRAAEAMFCAEAEIDERREALQLAREELGEDLSGVGRGILTRLQRELAESERARLHLKACIEARQRWLEGVDPMLAGGAIKTKLWRVVRVTSLQT